MKITKVNLSDINEIAKIENECFEDVELYSLQQLIDCVNDSNYLFLKITINEEIVAFCLSNLTLDHIDLCQIAVKKEFRNKSYGTQLIDYLINFNLPIFIEVNEINHTAINFYLKNGFQQISIRKKYYKNHNGIIMKKC